MPAEAMDKWLRRRNEWLALHGIIAKERESPDLGSLPPEHRKEYRQRFGEGFQSELDLGFGACVLKDPENASIVENSMRHFDGDRYRLGDFVIMPNHVHVLVVPEAGQDLGEILGSWKSYSAKEINRRIGGSGALWQRENFDHMIRSRKQLESVRDYIRDNPAKAHLPEGTFRIGMVEWEFPD